MSISPNTGPLSLCHKILLITCHYLFSYAICASSSINLIHMVMILGMYVGTLPEWYVKLVAA